MDPFEIFEEWYLEAISSEINDPNAVALATSTTDGRPSVRMVLLKEFSEKGFTFYTNLNSRKGVELRSNSYCALTFHWKSLKKQVRIEGIAKQVDDDVADRYFKSRNYLSKVGAWASKQSQVMNNLLTLHTEISKILCQHPIPDNVPRPPHWSGFIIEPYCIEFWEQGMFRLHHRIRYTLKKDKWKKELLYP